MGTHVREIEHRNAKIVSVDLRNLHEVPALLAAYDEVRAFVARCPLGSVRTLVDLTGARLNEETIAGLKQLAKDDKPYVKASAIVGLTRLQRFILVAIKAFSQRSTMMAFESVDEAKDWLAAQP